MPLFIRDPSVEGLARKAMKLTRAKNLTETVRRALENEIARERMKESRTDIIRALQEELNNKFPKRSSAPSKEFYDDMWGDE